MTWRGALEAKASQKDVAAASSCIRVGIASSAVKFLLVSRGCVRIWITTIPE